MKFTVFLVLLSAQAIIVHSTTSTTNESSVTDSIQTTTSTPESITQNKFNEYSEEIVDNIDAELKKIISEDGLVYNSIIRYVENGSKELQNLYEEVIKEELNNINQTLTYADLKALVERIKEKL